jgi:hypothetical protein
MVDDVAGAWAFGLLSGWAGHSRLHCNCVHDLILKVCRNDRLQVVCSMTGCFFKT